MKIASKPRKQVVAARRDRDLRFEVVVGAPREMLDLEAAAESVADGVDDFQCLGGDVLADAVSGDDCDAHGMSQ